MSFTDKKNAIYLAGEMTIIFEFILSIDLIRANSMNGLLSIETIGE